MFTNPMTCPMPPPPAVSTSLDEFLITELSIEEKRQLRMDLLSLPPEKLGEIIFILQKSQPQNIEEKGDEWEIDLKKLNTRTLRHLQRYVESVFAKFRYTSTQMNPNPQFMVPQRTRSQFITSAQRSPYSQCVITKQRRGYERTPRKPPRVGDEDKIFIFCAHTRHGSESKACGVHYVRHVLKHVNQAQHHCLGFADRKYITRTKGNLFTGCGACNGTSACIRDATSQEQADHIRWCDTQNINLFKTKKMLKHDKSENDCPPEIPCEPK